MRTVVESSMVRQAHHDGTCWQRHPSQNVLTLSLSKGADGGLGATCAASFDKLRMTKPEDFSREDWAPP